MTLRRHLRITSEFTRAQTGVAAVELALLAPVFMMFMMLLLDLGIAYSAKLTIVSATAAAAQYAYVNGQTVTQSTAPTFITQVAAVATSAAGLSPAPTVSVSFNNAPDGSNANSYFCVSGSSPSTAAWVNTGTSSSSCGGSVMSGKFVTINLSTTTTTVFYPNSLVSSIVNISDAAIVRLQ